MTSKGEWVVNPPEPPATGPGMRKARVQFEPGVQPAGATVSPPPAATSRRSIIQEIIDYIDATPAVTWIGKGGVKERLIDLQNGAE